MFNQDQIQQLKNIISSRMIFYMANYISPDLLSKDEKQMLTRAGVDVKAIRPQDTLIYQAFALGMISGAVPQSVLNATSYDQFKQHLISNDVIPLNSYERGVLHSIQTQSLSDIKGLSNRFEKFLDDQLIVQSREHFERTIRKEMEAGTSQKKSLRIISNEISKKLGDFSRDFDRIVQTQSAIATQEGRKAFIERNYGEDSLVYVDVYGGACKICIRDYLTSGLGSQPKIFKLNELPPSSTNYGKKQKDWVVVQPPHHPYCFDKETEVLTNEGWKYFNHLNKNETFLSVNLNAGEGEYIKAIRWIKHYYEGQMVYRYNKNFNLMTSPNHYHVITTKDIKYPHLRSESDLPIWSRFLTHIPQWRGVDKMFKFGELQFSSSDFAEFMGFFISEGCVIKVKYGVRLHISQSPKKYLEEIYECCKRVFKDRRVCKCKDYVQITLRKEDVDLIDYLQLGKSSKKYIPEDIKNLPTNQLKLFLNSFCMGDGSFVKGKIFDGYRCKDSRVFYTSSKKLADDLGELIFKIGKKPSFKYKDPISVYDPKRKKSFMQNAGIFIISELKSKYSYRHTMIEEWVDYKDYIYDVELERNHTLIVRRGGKVAVSGNCRCHMHPIPNGYVWDDELKQFVPGKIVNKIPRKSKVNVTFNGKKYSV